MSTLVKTNNANISASRTEDIEISSNSDFWESLEYNRLGVTVMLLLIVACIGGAAAAFGAHTNLVQLGAVVLSTVFVEAMILSVGPIRLIIGASALALIIDLVVFIF